MLNPTLYFRLLKLFEDVHITNESCAADIVTYPDWSNGGRLISRASGEAEHYAVDCPFCGDSRKRLCIHYLYGTQDEDSGNRYFSLAHCHNENCIADDDNRTELRNMIMTHDNYVLPPRVVTRKVRPQIIPELPKGLVPISSRKADLDARSYLANRRFDVDELWRYWRVAYCGQNRSVRPHFDHRIVIPFYEFASGARNKAVSLRGWQSRALDESRKCKYLTMTGMRKSKGLYGLPWALQTKGPLIICEGVTDVWRLKFNAVALLGKTISVAQCQLLRQRVGKRDVVILLDNDAQNECTKIAKMLKGGFDQFNMKNRILSLTPPRNRKDVGECKRVEIWRRIEEAVGKSLDRLGVDLDCDEVPRYFPSLDLFSGTRW